MGTAPERTLESRATSPRTQSRALHALPITALVVDLVVITATVFLAAFARGHVPLFGATAEVAEPAALIGLPLVARAGSP